MSGREDVFQKAMNEGHSFAWDQEWSKAAAAYRNALQEMPDHPKALNSLGLALFQQGEFDEALQIYKRVAQVSPQDPSPMEKLAQLLERTGHLKEAIDAAFKAADLSDLDAVVRLLERQAPYTPLGGWLWGDPGDEAWNRNGMFLKLMRNRRGLCIDLKAATAGRATFLELVAGADVVIENFSARAMPDLGLDYDTLRAVNPGIVLVCLTGYGAAGPYQDRVAFGPTVEPLSGLGSLLGYGPGEWSCTSMGPSPRRRLCADTAPCTYGGRSGTSSTQTTVGGAERAGQRARPRRPQASRQRRAAGGDRPVRFHPG